MNKLLIKTNDFKYDNTTAIVTPLRLLFDSLSIGIKPYKIDVEAKNIDRGKR